MKILLYVFACCAGLLIGLMACNAPPQGQYSAAQVQQGLKDAVNEGLMSQPQADAVAGKIATASTGIPWGSILTGATSVALSLAGVYVGAGKVHNRKIIGAEEAAVLEELVARKRTG